MAIPAAAGTPQNSGTLIPEIWSGKLLQKWYASTVLAAISNTDYEGEIKSQGDKVWIRTTPDIEIRDYQKGGTLTIQRPEVGKVSLTIDRAKYWNFVVDDIDKFQSDINFMDDWSRDAAEQIKIVYDREALGSIYVDASAANKGVAAGLQSGSINLGATGAPIAVGNGSGSVNPIDFVLRVSQALDEQNVPESDRFIIIPTWMSPKLKLSDLKNAFLTGDAKSPIRNGLIGDIDRNHLYISNLLSTVQDGGDKCWNVIGGQKSALSYAASLTENEMIKAESTFGMLGRGLAVCGWKVLKPEALVHAYVKQGA